MVFIVHCILAYTFWIDNTYSTTPVMRTVVYHSYYFNDSGVCQSKLMTRPDRGAIRTYGYYHKIFLISYPVQKGWVWIIANLCPYKRLHADRVDLRALLVQFLSLDWEQHCKLLAFISSSRLTSYSSFYSYSPPWQNSSRLHHLVIFIFCLISFDVISFHHPHRHHHSCRQFLLDYHVLLLYTRTLHTFLSYFSFFVFLSLHHTLFTTHLLLTFRYCVVLFCQKATDLSQLSLALEMSTRIPSYLWTATKNGVWISTRTFWRSCNIASFLLGVNIFERNKFQCKSRMASLVRSRRWQSSSLKLNSRNF